MSSSKSDVEKTVPGFTTIQLGFTPPCPNVKLKSVLEKLLEILVGAGAGVCVGVGGNLVVVGVADTVGVGVSVLLKVLKKEDTPQMLVRRNKHPTMPTIDQIRTGRVGLDDR